MEEIREVTIAAKDEVFDHLLRKSARIAKFRSKTAEAKYQEKDEALRNEIIAVVKCLFRPRYAEKHLDVGWDWWPDHTRHIAVSIDGFNQKLFDGLHALLTDEYQKWRIQVIVYGDLLDGTMVGSLVIWADRLLIDRPLYGLLKWRGVDLRCSSYPTWRQSGSTRSVH